MTTLADKLEALGAMMTYEGSFDSEAQMVAQMLIAMGYPSISGEEASDENRVASREVASELYRFAGLYDVNIFGLSAERQKQIMKEYVVDIVGGYTRIDEDCNDGTFRTITSFLLGGSKAHLIAVTSNENGFSSEYKRGKNIDRPFIERALTSVAMRNHKELTDYISTAQYKTV